MSDLDLAKVVAGAVWPDLTWDYIEKHSDTTMFREIGDAVLSSAWLDQLKREAGAEALDGAAAEYQERLLDGTGNGRAYNSYTVARMLRERAAANRAEDREESVIIHPDAADVMRIASLEHAVIESALALHHVAGAPADTVYDASRTLYRNTIALAEALKENTP